MYDQFNSRRFMTGSLMMLYELARQKLHKAMQEEKALFIELPKMGDSYVGYTFVCFNLFRVTSVIIFIIGVLAFIFLPIKTSEDIIYCYIFVMSELLIILGTIVAYLFYQYYMNTR